MVSHIFPFPRRRNKEDKKILLVSVNSLFDAPSLSEKKYVYDFAIASVRKAFKLGWGVQFWSIYPRRKYSMLVRELQECGLWDFADPEANEPLLLRSSPKDETPVITKLSLLESHFGDVLDGKVSTRLAVVEKNFGVAQTLKQYGKGRVHVHLAPSSWLNLVAIGNHRFDHFLEQGLVA